LTQYNFFVENETVPILRAKTQMEVESSSEIPSAEFLLEIFLIRIVVLRQAWGLF
jgi:hypothetical protein